MNIPKIDKEIIDKFFPDEEYEVGYISPRKSLREYSFNDGERHLLIGTVVFPETVDLPDESGPTN